MPVKPSLVKKANQRIKLSRQAQRQVGQTTRMRILSYMRARAQRGEMPPSHREIMQACAISSTSVVNYHLRILEQKGEIIRDLHTARASRLPAGHNPAVQVDLPTTAPEFEVLRTALLAYWIKAEEPGLYQHWERRCVAWDELPFLIEAVIRHARNHAR